VSISISRKLGEAHFLTR